MKKSQNQWQLSTLNNNSTSLPQPPDAPNKHKAQQPTPTNTTTTPLWHFGLFKKPSAAAQHTLRGIDQSADLEFGILKLFLLIYQNLDVDLWLQFATFVAGLGFGTVGILWFFLHRSFGAPVQKLNELDGTPHALSKS